MEKTIFTIIFDTSENYYDGTVDGYDILPYWKILELQEWRRATDGCFELDLIVKKPIVMWSDVFEPNSSRRVMIRLYRKGAEILHTTGYFDKWSYTDDGNIKVTFFETNYLKNRKLFRYYENLEISYYTSQAKG